ncbi:unnamed protein product [Mesocestoides corti]|uniref:LisH domain-containing protein n=1 Tax=Mesocestoides corti TaxID=53468 RepID=A0A0R3UEK3_MESCO|nr:unnamed protein product [Mesocestoides corti]
MVGRVERNLSVRPSYYPLVSCVSVSTLDSPDLQTVSEDQNSLEEQFKGKMNVISDDSVLEFELRKKNEEIKSLRELLTSATLGAPNVTESLDSITPTPSDYRLSKAVSQMSNIEARALHFLINEYLLSSGYKLTAVQFSEECEALEQQDLDDWDDVGLTCDRPPSLPSLLKASWLPQSSGLPSRPMLKLVPQLRAKGASLSNHQAIDEEAVQTEAVASVLREDLESSRTAISILQCNYDATKAELEVSRQHVADLRGKVTRLESENLSLSQESTYWRNQILCLKRDFPDLVGTAVKKTNRNSALNGTANRNTIDSHEATLDLGSAGKAVENGQSQGIPPSPSPLPSPPPPPQPDHPLPEVVVEVPKLSINEPMFRRQSHPEFVRCASELLPPAVIDEFPFEAFRLADTLDELIVTVGDLIQGILKHLPDEMKSLALPLLIQAICLHPDAAVRDQLLRALFNLFTESPEPGSKEVEVKRTDVILPQCRDLATCLGPQRIESELLPQIWSQLNERPSSCLRKLLNSACGVIAPATPSRLRSSLLLSILLQSIEEEKDEQVKAVALRSLAAVVVLMEDRDKLPQLATTFERSLRETWGDATTTLPYPQLVYERVPTVLPIAASLTVAEASCNWLLPTVAEWCLEVDSLKPLLLDPWLEKLKSLCFVSVELLENEMSKSKSNCNGSSEKSIRLKLQFSTSELFRIMTVLNRLVPFLFASVLQSLAFIKPYRTSFEDDCDDLVLENTDAHEEAVNEAGERDFPIDHWEYLFVPQCILGRKRYEELVKSFEHVLVGSMKSVSDGAVGEGDDVASAFNGACEGEWPAMDDVRQHLLLPIAEMLRAMNPHSNSIDEGTEAHEYLEQDPILPQEFLSLMQTQFDDNFWLPWRLRPASCTLTLCKELCFYVSLIGKAFGTAAVQKYLYEPFHSQLMERSVQGYFEFDLKALPSGVFAGYCCLLASTKSKSELNKVKMLIANAIFLHSRDSCSLHGVRAAIMALCYTEDAAGVCREVLLPALRSCASCADPAVRRTASNIFYTLIGYLSDEVGFNSAGKSNKLSTASSRHHDRQPSWAQAAPSLLEECWQLASQLARDDYTSIGTAAFTDFSSPVLESQPIDEHSADWSCISVALGPLFCLYSKMLRPSPYVAEMDLRDRRSLSEDARIADQVLVLITRLMSLVSADNQTSLDPSAVQFLVQQQYWETLVSGLLQVANRLLPTCSEDFRDTKILPWLYRLTEINNMIPDMEQRTRLGQRLTLVFSTASFCLGTEAPVTTWIMPGLDRLRLDFVEAGEKISAEELEQLSSDLRQRLAIHSSPP